MGKQFKNPHNDYVVEVSGLAWFWTLLFGCLYFAVRGVWKHVFISLILSILTFGLSWLIYPFFARGILEKHYLVNGWKEVPPSNASN